MNQYEVGAVTAHPVVFAWRQVKGIIRTWLWARKNGHPFNRWYGVYHKGTELVAAQMGCLPDAEQKARVLTDALNGVSR